MNQSQKKKKDQQEATKENKNYDFVTSTEGQIVDMVHHPKENKDTDKGELETGKEKITTAGEKELEKFAKMEERLEDLSHEFREIPELELDDATAKDTKEAFGKWAKEGLPIDKEAGEEIDPARKKIFEACQDQFKKVFGQKSKINISELDLNELKQVAIDSYGDKGKKWFEDQDKLLQKADKETDSNKKKTWKKLAVEAVDFIPFIGPTKILGEAIYGKRISDLDKQLTTGQRLYMLAEGGVFLALDLTGYGIVATEGLRAGKLMTRVAALARMKGLPSYVSKSIFKVGRVLIKHPEAAKVVDKSFQYIIESRQAKKLAKVGEVKDIFADKQVEEEEGRMMS